MRPNCKQSYSRGWRNWSCKAVSKAGSHKVAKKNNPVWGLTVSNATAEAEETEAAKQFWRTPQLILFSKNSRNMISSSILVLLSCMTFMCVVSHSWLIKWEPSQIPELPPKYGPLPTYKPKPLSNRLKTIKLCIKNFPKNGKFPFSGVIVNIMLNCHASLGIFVGLWSVPMETD